MSPLKHDQPSQINGKTRENYHNRNTSGVTYRMMNLKRRIESIGQGDSLQLKIKEKVVDTSNALNNKKG